MAMGSYAWAGSSAGNDSPASTRLPPRWLAAANGRAPTQTPELVRARPRGELPTKILRTWPVPGSMWASVAPYSLLTHTPPGPATMACGPSPTGMVSVPRPVTVSILVTLRSRELATHTADGVTAMPAGPAPTKTGPLGWPVAGSTRVTVPSWPLATQTAPGP